MILQLVSSKYIIIHFFCKFIRTFSSRTSFIHNSKAILVFAFSLSSLIAIISKVYSFCKGKKLRSQKKPKVGGRVLTLSWNNCIPSQVAVKWGNFLKLLRLYKNLFQSDSRKMTCLDIYEWWSTIDASMKKKLQPPDTNQKPWDVLLNFKSASASMYNVVEKGILCRNLGN